MKAYEQIMKFLDFALQRERQRALNSKTLKTKLANQEQIKRLEDTRRMLRLGFYDYKDFLATQSILGNTMTCKICGRQSCTESFHSLEEQEEFETKTGRYEPDEPKLCICCEEITEENEHLHRNCGK